MSDAINIAVREPIVGFFESYVDWQDDWVDNDVRDLFETGKAKLRAEQFDEAERLFLDALSRNPYSEFGLLGCCIANFLSNRLHPALVFAEQWDGLRKLGEKNHSEQDEKTISQFLDKLQKSILCEEQMDRLLKLREENCSEHDEKINSQFLKQLQKTVDSFNTVGGVIKKGGKWNVLDSAPAEWGEQNKEIFRQAVDALAADNKEKFIGIVQDGVGQETACDSFLLGMAHAIKNDMDKALSYFKNSVRCADEKTNEKTFILAAAQNLLKDWIFERFGQQREYDHSSFLNAASDGQSAEADENFVYLFFHIFKTAGMSLRDEFFGGLKPDHEAIHIDYGANTSVELSDLQPFELRDEGIRKNAKVIIGHLVTNATHKYVPDKSPRHVVILREPGAHFVSRYNHHMGGRGKVMSVNKYLNNDPRNFLALNIVEEFAGLPVPEDELALYEIADRILEKFWLVGSTENLAKDLRPVFSSLGIPMNGFRKNAAGSDYPKLLRQDRELTEVIWERSPVDAMLYSKWCLNTSDSQLALNQVVSGIEER